MVRRQTATDWHTDSPYEEQPPRLAILHAKEVPSEKGGTMFADMQAAYDALPTEMQERFSGLTGLHGRSSGRDGERLYAPGTGLQEALYFWIFPNLMLNIYPDNISTNLILPISHDKTLTVFEWFFQDATSSQSKERIRKAVQFSDEVQQEDIGLCESVQRGLRSATYDRGRYSVRRENGVHHFHMLLGEFLERA